MIDLRGVFYIQGILLLMLSGVMLIPLVADWAMGEPEWEAFGQAMLITGFVGGMLLVTNRGTQKQMNIRQAFVFTTCSYVVLSVFSALPLIFSGLELTLVDAIFEATSGITSTGSTVMSNLDQLPPGILLWRSIINSLGGLGIVVLAMAILPMLQIGGMQLFRTESSETMDKMLPRTKQLTSTIAIIFVSMIILCAICYRLAGMNGFDAINHAMTTVATGGFSTHDASLGYFDDPIIEMIAIFFMICGAVPLLLFYQMMRGKPLAILYNSQVQWLLIIISLAISVITIWLVGTGQFEPFQALRHAAFNVTSIVTTTGYAMSDYNGWGTFAVAVFFILIVIGGCTGSTSGGIKIFRFQILHQTAKMQLYRLMQPHGVFRPRYEGQPISEEISASVMSFIILFGVSFTVLAMVLSLFGLDFLTAMSASAQALANVGPGLGEIVGPAGNFSSLPDGAKWLLSAAMIFGRLELFTVIVLLTPAFWRH